MENSVTNDLTRLVFLEKIFLAVSLWFKKITVTVHSNSQLFVEKLMIKKRIDISSSLSEEM